MSKIAGFCKQAEEALPTLFYRPEAVHLQVTGFGLLKVEGIYVKDNRLGENQPQLAAGFGTTKLEVQGLFQVAVGFIAVTRWKYIYECDSFICERGYAGRANK